MLLLQQDNSPECDDLTNGIRLLIVGPSNYFVYCNFLIKVLCAEKFAPMCPWQID